MFIYVMIKLSIVLLCILDFFT